MLSLFLYYKSNCNDFSDTSYLKLIISNILSLSHHISCKSHRLIKVSAGNNTDSWPEEFHDLDQNVDNIQWTQLSLLKHLLRIEKPE